MARGRKAHAMLERSGGVKELSRRCNASAEMALKNSAERRRVARGRKRPRRGGEVLRFEIAQPPVHRLS